MFSLRLTGLTADAATRVETRAWGAEAPGSEQDSPPSSQGIHPAPLISSPIPIATSTSTDSSLAGLEIPVCTGELPNLAQAPPTVCGGEGSAPSLRLPSQLPAPTTQRNGSGGKDRRNGISDHFLSPCRVPDPGLHASGLLYNLYGNCEVGKTPCDS